MASVLKELRKRKGPYLRKDDKRPLFTEGMTTPGGVTSVGKLWLMEKLRTGCSYKQTHDAFKKKTGITIPQRTLARWASSFVAGGGKGKGRTPAGTSWNNFSDTLVAFLDRNYSSRSGSRRVSQWRYWGIPDIRFALIFSVPPQYASKHHKKLDRLLPEEFRNDTDPRRWNWWVIKCIQEHWKNPEEACRKEKILAALRKRFPSAEKHPLSGRVQFCDQSIRAALKKGGYVFEGIHLEGRHIWCKSAKTGKPKGLA